MGKEWMRFSLNPLTPINPQFRNVVSLDISGLPKGIYLMEISGQYVEKLVKQ